MLRVFVKDRELMTELMLVRTTKHGLETARFSLEQIDNQHGGQTFNGICQDLLAGGWQELGGKKKGGRKHK